MPDDKDKGGMKDKLRDEFDKATGKDKDKKKDDSSGNTKENVRDELDEATGKDEKKDS